VPHTWERWKDISNEKSRRGENGTPTFGDRFVID